MVLGQHVNSLGPTFPLSYEGTPVTTKESLRDKVLPNRVKEGDMSAGPRRVIKASNSRVSGFFLKPKITPCKCSSGGRGTWR
jgi:hypothetical protein